MRTSWFSAAVVLALSELIEARGVDLPQATLATVDLALYGWSPKPTAAPELLKKLVKRQTNSNSSSDDEEDEEEDDEDVTVFLAPDATCGYISGRAGAPYACMNDFQCVFYTPTSTFTGNAACCNTELCGVRLACVDYEEYYSSTDVCDDGCRLDAYTLKW